MVFTRKLLSKILRWPFSLIPCEAEVRILRGPLRGKKWVKGSGPNAYWVGTYEVARVRAFVDALKPGDVVYDVGAHVGIYTLCASFGVGASGWVYTFEPLARNLRYLRRNVMLNHLQNCTILESAVCNQEGTLAFLADRCESSMARLSLDGEISVPSTTLDLCVYGEKQLKPPNIIKIDVEGAEFEVLKGATRAITMFHPKIFLEIHGPKFHRDCRDFLLTKGYTVEEGYGQMTATWRAPGPLQGLSLPATT
jgi:FkbM family methyltransferase